ncbi:MAG: L-threonylcarbamoyladenylate synthase [Dehalococcoidales bacterium]|nr:L-threonylcarbamoyladenylate synthase [Dehalococcoidales bacterium]MDP6825353.1 L-threonylcarbamoyladenylate synthase [Dehalococcoidales bacterium]|tara:strand:+ start:466 stop:1131 length:666 start_codon:yes stop_codon:yes gene_type:complete
MAIEIVTINPKKPSLQTIRRAARLIVKGKVIVCPTDTGYAFAANSLNTKAVAGVFELKGRAYANPIHVAVDSLETAGKYAYLNEAAERLAHNFLPGALTLVLPKKEIVPHLLVAGGETIGIRIPDNRVILELAAMINLPLTATSANISGQPTPYSAHEILSQAREAMAPVALVLDQGPLLVRELSTIVDLTASPPQLLRQGRVSWLEIRQVLQPLHDLASE